MNHSHYQDQICNNTSPVNERGGCMTFPFTPLFMLLFFSVAFLMAKGETTNPWDLTPTSPGLGVVDLSSDVLVENESAIRELKTEEGIEARTQSKLTPLFTPEVMYWEENISAWAQEWGLDPNLVATVMQIESCGDPMALSRSGAMGLFQVMPYHFGEGEQPYTPNTNAKRGLEYLRKALNEYNNLRLAFAGYNGGIGVAGKTEYYWEDETIRYTYWGTGIYNDAAQGKMSSPRLAEWLSYGGASLCAQASERLNLTP